MATENLSKSATVLTNELRLHDWNNAKMSITFGESDQDMSASSGYSYLNLKFKADESKFDIIVDRTVFNIAGPTYLMFNDTKVWHEGNDGPNSGMNADMLDGRHAVEFKDRYGYHHFIHMFKPENNPAPNRKYFVKIARFTTRRIKKSGKAGVEFNKDGTPPFEGIFDYTGNGVDGANTNNVVVPGGTFTANDIISGMKVKDAITQFQADTPYALDDFDPDLFHSTSILTEGVYNGTLRACVSVLKNDHPTTFDFHLGLFEDPLTADNVTDGWQACKKYFYVSLHDETLPFLDESDWTQATKNDGNLNDGYLDANAVNPDTDDLLAKNNIVTKVNGRVINGYDKNGLGVDKGYYPNFPSYEWKDQALSSTNIETSTDNSKFVDDVTGIAMSNLFFDKPDGEKAKKIRELKLKYNNNAADALKAETAKLKDLGLAITNLEGEGTDAVETHNTARAKSSSLIDKIDDLRDDYDDETSDAYSSLGNVGKNNLVASSNVEAHDRLKTKVQVDPSIGNPPYNAGSYTKPTKTEEDAYPYKNKRRRSPFPANNAKDQGDSYQQFVDIMRLYHTSSRTDVIDGLSVDTHTFDLYMRVDGKSEVRVQPYMSSACILYNFQPCLQEADLPATKFIRPKSIYDNRYASVRHRHSDYERRIWEITLEVDQLWKNFSNYVKADQGVKNANKIMQTDSTGKVYSAVDNMERHIEPISTHDGRIGRPANKVLVTLSHNAQVIEGMVAEACSCIGTSDVTIDELYALRGIKSNVQNQLDSLEEAIDSVISAMDIIWLAIKKIAAELGKYVKKTGDTMTGSIWMDMDGSSTNDDDRSLTGGIPAYGFVNGRYPGGYTYGSTANCVIGWGFGPKPADWAVKWGIDSTFAINGTKIAFGKVGSNGSYSSSGGHTIDLEDLAKLLKDKGKDKDDDD